MSLKQMLTEQISFLNPVLPADQALEVKDTRPNATIAASNDLEKASELEPRIEFDFSEVAKPEPLESASDLPSQTTESSQEPAVVPKRSSSILRWLALIALFGALGYLGYIQFFQQAAPEVQRPLSNETQEVPATLEADSDDGNAEAQTLETSSSSTGEATEGQAASTSENPDSADLEPSELMSPPVLTEATETTENAAEAESTAPTPEAANAEGAEQTGAEQSSEQDLEISLIAMLNAIKSALANITDEASASEAQTQLETIHDDLKRLGEGFDSLDETNQTALADIARLGQSELEPIIENVNALPGVAEPLQETLTRLLETLSSFSE